MKRRYQNHMLALTCVLGISSACTAEQVGLNPTSLKSLSPNETQPTTGPTGNPNVASNGNNQVIVTGNVTYYRDIKPIATAKCATCHDAGGIGPFTLTDFNDWNGKMASIASDVAANIMPPWMPDDSCNSYDNDLSLTPTEKATIAQWVKLGGPEGDPNDYVAPAGTSIPPFRTDMTITMPKPFQVKTSPDEYRCFVLPWSPSATTYITGFGVKPGNSAIVHHAIVDIVPSSSAASVKSKDGADGSPGWECGQQGASLNWLGAWAPGSLPRTFGPGDTVGTKLSPGDILVLQMHYHVLGNPASAGTDASSVMLEMASTVEKQGHFVEILDLAWVAGGMPIPANQNDVVHNYTTTPDAAFLMAAQSLPSSNMAVYQVAAHMHQRGSIFNMSLTRGGQNTCLLDIPAWNFNWQNGYQLTKPFALQATDKVTLNCHWNNTAANQPVVNGVRELPRDLNWGEGTDDEMCIGFMYMAPQ